jgi:hypothetical protein
VRKTLLAAAIAAASLSGCRGWSDMHADVVELRQLHKTYREHTQAKDPKDQPQVERLSADLDSVMAKMEKLTE